MDFFELTGAEFDPPSTIIKAQELLQKKKKELNGVRGKAADELEKAKLKSEIDFLEKIETDLLAKNDKVKFNELAQTTKQAQSAKLKATLTALKNLNGTSTFTKGTINEYKKKFKLSPKTIEEIFVECGFAFLEVKKLHDLLKLPNKTRTDKVEKEFANFRTLTDANPNAKAQPAEVTDFYALAAYLAGELENTAEYRNKSTEELNGFFNTISQKFSSANDVLTSAYRNFASYCTTDIFASDEKRQAYDNFLKLQNPLITTIFDTLKMLDNTQWLNPQLAEPAIKNISAIFDNYEIALAVYNYKLGIESTPYIPVKPVFHVACNACGSASEFANIAEAQKINKCSHCAKPLYKNCPKCKKSVLARLDKCSECSFVFASVAMFAKHFAAAEKFFRESNFESAKNSLSQAELANPNEKARIADLLQQIKTTENLYKQPINELKKLIAENKFETAKKMVANTIIKFPNLNIFEFEKDINSALSAANAAFANAQKQPPQQQADECLAILQNCVDFSQAINYLQNTPPEPCTGFFVALDNLNACINISWKRAKRQGVTYRLIRKKGSIPANPQDGDILLDKSNEITFRDNSATTGVSYSYAVFAKRFGVFSAATGKSAKLTAEVTKLQAEQAAKSIRLAWNLPKNCTGVTICRLTGENETILTTLTNNARTSFEDTNVEYGKTYNYRVFANYNNLKSPGINISFTPMLQIENFSINCEQLENTYKISWDIKQKGVDLRIFADGKEIRKAKSDAKFCEIQLPKNGFYAVEVSAFSGGKWLKSQNSLQINTYGALPINKKKSQIIEDSLKVQLKIVVDNIPKNVVAFAYSVSTNKNEEGTRNKIKIATYKKMGEISYIKNAQEETKYYFTLRTIYDVNGKQVESEPVKQTFVRPIIADIFWKVSSPKSFLGLNRGNFKLILEISHNRAHGQLPELVLCCTNGEHINSLDNPQAKKIFDIEPEALENEQINQELEYEIFYKDLRGKKVFLFEKNPQKNKKYTLRWMQGFNGKV
ncbi:MAG: hypothetical protein FWG64_06815 [Firmicutes bacterium]|nr:hypothetical protein [Bacillota bacterium]